MLKLNQLDKLISRISDKGYNEKYLDDIDASDEVKSFLKHDLEVSMNGTLPEIIGAFTLGTRKSHTKYVWLYIACN